jgi:hypothetical protein
MLRNPLSPPAGGRTARRYFEGAADVNHPVPHASTVMRISIHSMPRDKTSTSHQYHGQAYE